MQCTSTRRRLYSLAILIAVQMSSALWTWAWRGISLFKRNRNKISLTAEGEELVAYVTEVLKAQEKLDQAVLSIKGVEKGTVRVGGLRVANSCGCRVL